MSYLNFFSFFIFIRFFISLFSNNKIVHISLYIIFSHIFNFYIIYLLGHLDVFFFSRALLIILKLSISFSLVFCFIDFVIVDLMNLISHIILGNI